MGNNSVVIQLRNGRSVTVVGDPDDIADVAGMVERHPILDGALKLANGIVRQANLLSTATKADRIATLDRYITWSNEIATPSVTGNPSFWSRYEPARLDAFVADLEAHSWYYREQFNVQSAD